MILEVKEIHTFYDTAHVIQGVSFSLEKGETVCLLGRNGAGKTTLLRSIINLTPPRSGQVIFKGENITGLEPYEISKRGIGFAPEDRDIFPTLTVRENLEIAEKKNKNSSSDWDIEKIYKKFPLLEKLDQRRGDRLSGGEQQLLCIARALIGNPELLLLDEPTKGLAPKIVKNIFDVVKEIKEGITILMAEQNTKFGLAIADRVYIIDKGLIVYQGSVDDLNKNKEIQNKHLAVL